MLLRLISMPANSWLSLLCLSMTLALSGCITNYPRQPDADLFLPLVTGFEEQRTETEFDYTANAPAFRISKALENHYIAASLEPMPAHHCGDDGVESGQQDPVTIRITKILKPMDWAVLNQNAGIFAGTRGGVLFGRGVYVKGGALLTLRYVLSPIEDDDRYVWRSETSGKSLKIPFRFVELREVSLSAEALKLLEKPTVIFKTEDGNEVLDVLEDNEEVVIDARRTYATLPKRAEIWAVRETDILFSDGPTMSPVRYQYPEKKQGWIDIINVSHFSEGGSYMDVVRALTLSQAGDCDTAFAIYMEKIAASKNLDKRTKNQVLSIIAHLHGQSGGDISKVLSAFEALNGKTALYEDFLALNKENRIRSGR